MMENRLRTIPNCLTKNIMNWKEIKNKYPKAYRICPYKGTDHTRYLYDFFDENGIWIFLDYEYSDNDSIAFYFQIIDIDNRTPSEYTYKLRKEAETAAFSKAFEILEEKLNQK